MCSFGIAYIVGRLSELNYNAWFGRASKDLIHTIVKQTEDGRGDRVLKVLRRLDADYRPTYENCANYVGLVNETVAEMSGETEIVPGSKWDTSSLKKDTWFGHWENDTGYWLIIADAVGRTIRVHRSGDSMPEMNNVVLSPDSQVLTFSEGDQFNHTVSLVNKYEATHEWRHAKSDQVWRTEPLHKLVRATTDMKRVTQVRNQSADVLGTQP